MRLGPWLGSLLSVSFSALTAGKTSELYGSEIDCCQSFGILPDRQTSVKQSLFQDNLGKLASERLNQSGF